MSNMVHVSTRCVIAARSTPYLGPVKDAVCGTDELHRWGPIQNWQVLPALKHKANQHFMWWPPFIAREASLHMNVFEYYRWGAVKYRTVKADPGIFFHDTALRDSQ